MRSNQPSIRGIGPIGEKLSEKARERSLIEEAMAKSRVKITRCPPSACGDPGIAEYYKKQNAFWNQKTTDLVQRKRQRRRDLIAVAEKHPIVNQSDIKE